MIEIKHIVEAYFNAAIHVNSFCENPQKVRNSFDQLDLENIKILVIARLVQQTLLTNYLDNQQPIHKRTINKKQLDLFFKRIGSYISIIENHSMTMRLKPIILQKDKNYLVDIGKSKRFLNFIKANKHQLVVGFNKKRLNEHRALLSQKDLGSVLALVGFDCILNPSKGCQIQNSCLKILARSAVFVDNTPQHAYEADDLEQFAPRLRR